MGDSSRKFTPKKQWNTINNNEQRTKEARNKKGKKISGKRVQTGSQNFSKDKRLTMEVKIHRSPAQD